MQVHELPYRDRVKLFAGIMGCCITFFCLGFFIRQVVGTLAVIPFFLAVMMGIALSFKSIDSVVDRMADRLPVGSMDEPVVKGK